MLPVLNARNTLHRAISSLLIQEEVDQIILVDDGSTDGSWFICQKFAENYPHIEILSHSKETNFGAPFCRNLGLRQVRNTWVQFMDADDELLPGKISDQLSCLEGDEAFVIGKYTFCTDDQKENKIPMNDVWSGLITTRLGLTSSNLWNADWIRKVGGWNESLPNMQEYYLMFEILKRNGKVAFSEGNLTYIHSQPNSITNSVQSLDKKRNNYFVFRQRLKYYLLSNGEYHLKRWYYYETCTGKMLSYHKPPFEVESNRFFFFLYRVIKKIIRN